MGFSLDISVPALTVFIQGLVSFFSPCILPLIPLSLIHISGSQTVPLSRIMTQTNPGQMNQGGF